MYIFVWIYMRIFKQDATGVPSCVCRDKNMDAYANPNIFLMLIVLKAA